MSSITVKRKNTPLHGLFEIAAAHIVDRWNVGKLATVHVYTREPAVFFKFFCTRVKPEGMENLSGNAKERIFDCCDAVCAVGSYKKTIVLNDTYNPAQECIFIDPPRKKRAGSDWMKKFGYPEKVNQRVLLPYEK